MAFFEERFPDSIAQGATGGPRWKTSKVEAGSGQRFANRDWSKARHYYEVSQAIKTGKDFAKVRAFFYVVFGAFDAFRFKDYSNFKVAQAEGRLALVSGSIYQMQKAESYGSRTYLREIVKPVSGTVTVFRTRSGATTSIAATVDHTTGRVTVAGHVALDAYAWAGEFDVPVNFVDDSMETAQWIGPDSSLLMSWPSIQLCENPNP